jgi:hypothetical protein
MTQKLLIPLTSDYRSDSLRFDKLKGSDQATVAVLKQVQGLEVHLALLTRMDIGRPRMKRNSGRVVAVRDYMGYEGMFGEGCGNPDCGDCGCEYDDRDMIIYDSSDVLGMGALFRSSIGIKNW